jgi:hypothetical protein
MKTLGPVICRWITKNLPDPGDPIEPFKLTGWQVELANHWYAIDGPGRFIHRRGQFRGPKGCGKSPFGAALAIAEFVGPVTFAGWDAKGHPKGRPWDTPVVQILATAEGQAISNVYNMVERLLNLNDHAAAEALNIDVGKTRLYLKDSRGAELRPVTSAADAREGQRVTFALFDESQLLVPSSGGVELARTLMRNAAKMGGRALELANAYLTGAGSVAERTEAAAKAGEHGVLLHTITSSRIPDPDEPDDALLELLEGLYEGSPWIDPRRILEEIRDPAVPWEEALRFYFNVPGSEIGVLVDLERWLELESEPEPIDGKPAVALGFVGQSGYAALVSSTETGRLFMVEGMKDPDRAAIRDTVRMTLNDLDVKAFYADPRGWPEVEEWQTVLGDRCLAFPTSSPRRMAPAIDRLRAAVTTGEISHDGDVELLAHVAATRVRETRSGYTLESIGEGRPITLALAACLAFEACAHAQWAPLQYVFL